MASVYGAASAAAPPENVHADRSDPGHDQAAAAVDMDDAKKTVEALQGNEKPEDHQMAGAEVVDACAAAKDHDQMALVFRGLL